LAQARGSGSSSVGFVIGPTAAVMTIPVRLNIYDVSTNPTVEKINHALMAVGTGAFHAGVEVQGLEYSYGYIQNGSGVFSNEPRASTLHHFRETLDVGTTNLSGEEVESVVAELREEWQGCDYDLLRRNCVSFALVLVDKLGAGPIPTWVSNLAGAGATLQDGFMQAATTAQAVAIVAAAKAGEMDAQYNIRGTAKAKVTDLIEATKAFDEQYRLKSSAIHAVDQSAAALQALDEQYHLMDQATKAADTGAAVFQQGVDLLILKASEADGKYRITEQAKSKYVELDEIYQITEKATQAKESVHIVIEAGEKLLNNRNIECCLCQ